MRATIIKYLKKGIAIVPLWMSIGCANCDTGQKVLIGGSDTDPGVSDNDFINGGYGNDYLSGGWGDNRLINSVFPLIPPCYTDPVPDDSIPLRRAA